MAKVSNRTRREIYAFYRRIGYSPAQAAGMRNRVKGVWTDYNEHVKENKFYGTEPQKPPKISLSKSHRVEVRQGLKDAGLNKTVIDKWLKEPADKAQFKQDNIRKYMNKFNEMISESGGKEKTRLKKAMGDFKRLVKRAKSDKRIWRILQDYYPVFAGV